MILLLKASLVTALLYGFYKLMLEKESFFSANRYYLIGCLLVAYVLPSVVVPKMMENQGYLDGLLHSTMETKVLAETPLIEKSLVTLSDESDTMEEIIPSSEKGLEDEHSTKSTVDTGILETQQSSDKTSKGLSYWIFWIYIFGVVVLSINFLSQITCILWKVSKSQDQIQDDGVVIINLKGEIEPCSFFKFIFINPSLYDFETYEQIIAHEKIHIHKRHCLDLLFSELAVIILWFNPFVWLFRKEVEKNIEYQTDDLLINNNSEEKQNYQLNLVKIACTTSPLAITTNYNQSLIKQRILRMNAKKSNKFNYWKYAFSMPLIFAMLLVLNQPLPSIAKSTPPVLNDFH